MSGLSPKLPIRRDKADGYALNKTHAEVILQNMKNIIFTNPGERIMIPDFGVGLMSFLHEQNDVSVYSNVASRIKSQIKKWMPFVTISNIQIINSTHIWGMNGQYELLPEFHAHHSDPNAIGITVFYSVEALSLSSTLNISI